VSAAAAKRTVLAAVSLLAFATLAILVPASGASDSDTQSPTTPQNLRVTSATPSLVTVVWDASTDDVGVKGYEIRRSDQAPVTVDKPEYAVTGLQCGQSTRLRVAAFDEAQNRSGKATLTVATTACLDTQPPAAPRGFMQIATTADAVVLGWSPSSDNVGVVEYAVYRNLQRVVTTAEPNATLGGLACGSTYSYLADAADAAGNRSLQTTVYVRTADCGGGAADTTPPSAPTGLVPTSVTPTALALSWNAATDNVAVTGYNVYRDGTKVASPTTTSVSQSGLACGKSYLFKVSAHDAAGNTSPRAKRSVSTNACPSSADSTPPSSPTGLAASGVTQTGFVLSWTASSDDTGVAGYDVYRDGNKVASPTATSVTQNGLACGKSYALEVSARDAAGNASPRALLTVSTGACATPPADTTPPSTPPGLGVSGATRTSVLLGWNASIDNSGVAGYRVYINGTYTTTATQLSATILRLSCGTAYTFGVEAVDAVGNTSVRASVTGSTTACPDIAAPTAPTNLVTTSRTATSVALSWSASNDDVGVTGYGLYRGGSSTGMSSSTTGIFSGLVCGTNYTLAVDANDAAGNRSPQTVVMVSTTACPDTTPPSVPTTLSASSVTQTSLTLTWTGSTDNVGVSGYDVYRGGTKMATVSTTSTTQSGLACGTSYTFAVAARDAVGNASSRATLSVQTAACAAPPPPPSPVTAHFVSDWSTGKIAYTPWATIFEPGTPSTVDVGYYGSPPVASAPSGRVAVAPNPYGPGNVLKCEIRNSDPSTGSNNFQKAEVGSVEAVTWDGPWSDGQEIWIAMELYLPDAFGLASGGSNSFTNIADLHPSSNSGVPGLGLGGYSTTNIQLYAGVPGSLQRKDFIPLTPANRNRKLDILIGAKIGTSGWVEAWLNGVNVVPRFSAATAEASEQGPYWKQGLYKETASSFPNGGSTIYFGHTYIGKTKASVGA
jgi:chitodextrinase